MFEYKNKEFKTQEIKSFLMKHFKPKIRQILLEVTSRCNFRCLHCYNQGLAAHKEMSYAEICSILDQLPDLGTYAVNITGGEPLLRTDFWKIIKYAKKKGLSINFLTNGSLITEEIVKKLHDFYCRVFVSIYGMSNKTYKITTGKGVFTRVRCAVEAMYKEQVPFELKYILMKENFSDYSKYVKWHRSMKLGPMELMWKLMPGRAKDKYRFPLRHTLTNSQLKKLAEKHPSQVFPIQTLFNLKEGNIPICDLITERERFEISASGQVSPCNYMTLPSTPNFRDKPLKEIFLNDPLFVNFRNWKIKDFARCKNCKYLRYCKPCTARFYLHTGRTSNFKPSREMCRAWKVKFVMELHKKLIKAKPPTFFSKIDNTAVLTE